MAKLAMFNSTGGPPVVGGLVRSGMGTRVAQVLLVLPHPCGTSWVAQVRYIGAIHAGVWVPPTHLAAYGGPHLRWVAVHSTSRSGWHAVVGGALCPMPQGPMPWGGNLASQCR